MDFHFVDHNIAILNHDIDYTAMPINKLLFTKVEERPIVKVRKKLTKVFYLIKGNMVKKIPCNFNLHYIVKIILNANMMDCHFVDQYIGIFNHDREYSNAGLQNIFHQG